MTLATTIKRVARQKQPNQKKGPVWEGPSGDGPNGGISYSTLSRFLCCRERFRLLVVEGLRPAPAFNHKIEYGQMWHVCEQGLAEAKGTLIDGQTYQPFLRLNLYASILCKKYRMQQEQIDHWYNVCKTQFPLYVDYWSEHPDVTERTPLLQEQVFDVPYQLPSGRTVRLRGKWDSVDLIGKGLCEKCKESKAGPRVMCPLCYGGKGQGIYLQENKTKGDIREGQLKRQLSFDLQSLFYIIALQEAARGGKIL